MLKQYRTDTRSMRFYLKDTQIDTFIKMVRNATIRDMKPVLAAQNIQQYNRMQGEAQLDD